jgi:type IV secretory pathway VirB9-like protein
MRLVWTAVAVLLASTAYAQGTGIRDVSAGDTTIATIHTQLRFTTLIVLPDGDDIVEIVCGDADNWVIGPKTQMHNIAYVKPAKEKAITNLNLVATSGAIYSFLIKEVSGTGAQADLRVNVVPDPTRTTQAAPKYYTADAYQALRSEVDASKALLTETRARAITDVTQATAQAPAAMQFPYEIALNTPPFLVRMMWHDGKFTYIRADAQELPALYEVKDDKPALVEFSVKAPNLYVVPKILGDGYLQLGKTKLPFHVKAKP